MEVIILIFFLTWYLLVIALIIGLRKSAEASLTHIGKTEGLRTTVIVPVRNEEQHLSALLEDLISQTLLPYEIFVVNDHSEDQTLCIARRFAARYPCIKVISLPDHFRGKKAALQAAVEASSGEVIVTTDGDCRVPRQWLECIIRNFLDPNVQMVAGPVLFGGHSPAARILNIEQLVLLSAAVSSLQLGYPLFCSGANMAFRKTAFEEVRGYEGFDHLASGDDVFLMQKISQQYPRGMVYCASPDCRVTTQAPSSLRAFVSQRVRWAGKWRLLGRNVQVLAAFVFFFQLLVMAIPILAMNWLITLPYVLGLIGLKWMLEGILVVRVARQLQVSFSAGRFVLVQLLYPIYVVAIGLLSFRRKTSWKGRSISTR